VDEWTSGRVDEWTSGRVDEWGYSRRSVTTTTTIRPVSNTTQHGTTTHLVKRHWARVFQLLVVDKHLDQARGVEVLLVITRIVVHTLEHRTCG